jgi:hypothetical protein
MIKCTKRILFIKGYNTLTESNACVFRTDFTVPIPRGYHRSGFVTFVLYTLTKPTDRVLRKARKAVNKGRVAMYK